MENIIKTFIYIHAFFGGIGLLFGFLSVLFVKGSVNHKKAGTVFSYAMIISSLISLPICLLPKHENNFLFLIGIFTIYLVVSGNRVLIYKKKKEVAMTDKIVSGVMFIASVLMLVFGIINLLKNNLGGILFLFFGLIAFMFSIRDYRFYTNLDKSKILKFHIGKMSGTYIASITAFLVAGIHLQGILYWILPTVIGTFFIIYWTKKTTKQ